MIPVIYIQDSITHTNQSQNILSSVFRNSQGFLQGRKLFVDVYCSVTWPWLTSSGDQSGIITFQLYTSKETESHI